MIFGGNLNKQKRLGGPSVSILSGMELGSMEATACNCLNRGCGGALIGVPSTSSMTLSIMMVSDNFWDKEVALIGGSV